MADTWNEGLRLLFDDERALAIAEGKPCSITSCDLHPTYARSFNCHKRNGGTDIRRQAVCTQHAEEWGAAHGIALPTVPSIAPVKAIDQQPVGGPR